MTHQEREELKADGRQKYLNAQNDDERAKAWVMTIEAHFWRSLEAYGYKHPEFHVYASHWVEAQKHRIGELLEKEVFEILQKWYPAPKSPRIPPGMSYWHSPRGMRMALAQKW